MRLGITNTALPREVAHLAAREVIFEVTEALEGGFHARALGHSIFTHGDHWDDLKAMVREAVICHFGDEEAPQVIRLNLFRDEAIAT